jgi:hypothetical protein
LFKAIAALVVAMLAAGCTSVEHGKGSTAPPAGVQTAQSTPHQPVPDLKAQLLTLADLPAGWSIDNSSSGDDPSTPPCLQRPDTKLHTTDKANASFVKGSSGLPAFAQAIGYFGDKAAASGEFSADAVIFNGCKDVSFTSDGQKITGSIRPMSFPTFGDQSQAWGGTFTAPGGTFGFDIFLMQKGAELESLVYGDLGPPDVKGLQTLAKSAADKMP